MKAATLTIDTVEQFYIEVDPKGKVDALARVIKEEKPDQAIIFVRTKIGVDRLARDLDRQGIRVKALHGDMSQGQRDGVMIAFKGERERLLVATDVAARGLDISGVTHVFNYDPPNSPDVYVHRIGRTGRVGRSGRAITMITAKQKDDLEAIERHAKTEIVEWAPGKQTEAAKAAAAKPHLEAKARGGEPELDTPAARDEPKPTPQPRSHRSRLPSRRPRRARPGAAAACWAASSLSRPLPRSPCPPWGAEARPRRRPSRSRPPKSRRRPRSPWRRPKRTRWPRPRAPGDAPPAPHQAAAATGHGRHQQAPDRRRPQPRPRAG